MLWIKAFHIIFAVAWFSGLFYLPRLYVYHADTLDFIGKERFKVMEKKLFYFIMTPSAILTILFGIWVVHHNPAGYLQTTWMHLKLELISLLVLYHIYLGKWLHDFKHDKNKHGSTFYRWINEIPTVLLILIVIVAVVKPA